jgi:hypothetical protein
MSLLQETHNQYADFSDTVSCLDLNASGAITCLDLNASGAITSTSIQTDSVVTAALQLTTLPAAGRLLVAAAAPAALGVRLRRGSEHRYGGCGSAIYV